MYEYVIEDGVYVQTISGQEICRMDVVAFLFDRKQRCLLGHGDLRTIYSSYEEKRQKRCLNGFRELADDLVYFWGKFDLVEINAMANSTDYVVDFYNGTFWQSEEYPSINKFEL